MSRLVSAKNRVLYAMAGMALLALGVIIGLNISAMVSADDGDDKSSSGLGRLGNPQAAGIGFPLVFQPGGVPAWSLAFNLYSDGANVGIGTTSPVARLDVAGGVRAEAGFFNGFRTGSAAFVHDILGTTLVDNALDGTGAVGLVVHPKGLIGQAFFIAKDLDTLNFKTGPHRVGFDVSDGSLYFNALGEAADVRIFRPTTSTLAFQTGDSERVRIDGDGNVGIGTTSPQSALQVKGYTQLDLTAGAPPAEDCDEASERGRMKVDPDTDTLWVCMTSGWIAK